MEVGSTEQSAFEVGSIISGRYQVIAVLGSGTMGTVLRAIDRTLDSEPVALKLLFPHLVKDKVVFARFRNEVILSRRLSHPNIVRLYDFGSAGGGYYYISMEFVAGYTLKERIYSRRFEPLTFNETLRILAEIGSGLTHAHKQGVIHRDLKPDNILISDRGEVKITDFGLARQVQIDKGYTQTGETVGTPCYMAPEQIRGEAPDLRADIYSLGIMAYELVEGRRPFDSDSWLTLAEMHLRDPLPEFDPELNVPKWFQDFVYRSTAKRADDRFQSVEEWASVLDEQLRPRPVAAVSVPAILNGIFARSARVAHVNPRRRRTWRRALNTAVISCVMLIALSAVVRSSTTLQRVSLKTVSSLESVVGLHLTPIKRLLGINFNVSEQSLSRAVQANDANAVGLLLAAGASRDLHIEGLPLGHYAAAKASALLPEIVADVEAPLPTGETLLMTAAKSANAESVRTLLALGANANARGPLGETALSYAVTAGSLPTVQELLKVKAFVNGKDDRGNTVLHRAVRRGDPVLVQTLLDGGAKVDERDHEGWTPLLRAAAEGNEPISKILLSRGASPEARTPDGKGLRELGSIKIRKAATAFTAPVADVIGVEPRSAAPDLTRLRIVEQPEGKWLYGKVTRLLQVSTAVRNVGEESASNVKVMAQLPGGREISLRGNSIIGPNAVERFSVELEGEAQVVSGPGTIKVLVTCENCRK